VAAIFILVAIDEGPGGSNIKYQFNEINKLHSVISILVRCCDCTEKCVSSAPVSTCKQTNTGPPSIQPLDYKCNLFYI